MDDREFERARDVYQRISAPKELREKVLRQAASAASVASSASSASAASAASAQEAGIGPEVKSQGKAGSRSGGGFGGRWKKTYYGGALAACLAVFVFLWGLVPAGVVPEGVGPAGEADMVSVAPDGDETEDSVASFKNEQAASPDETKVQDRAGSDQNRADPASGWTDPAQNRAAQAQDRSLGGTGETAAAGDKQNSGPADRAADPADARAVDAAPVGAKASKPSAVRAADPAESARDSQNGMTQGNGEGLISGQPALETGEEPCDAKATAQAMESSEGHRREFDEAGLIPRRQFFDDTWTTLPREDGRTKTEQRGEND